MNYIKLICFVFKIDKDDAAYEGDDEGSSAPKAGTSAAGDQGEGYESIAESADSSRLVIDLSEEEESGNLTNMKFTSNYIQW